MGVVIIIDRQGCGLRYGCFYRRSGPSVGLWKVLAKHRGTQARSARVLLDDQLHRRKDSNLSVVRYLCLVLRSGASVPVLIEEARRGQVSQKKVDPNYALLVLQVEPDEETPGFKLVGDRIGCDSGLL